MNASYTLPRLQGVAPLHDALVADGELPQAVQVALLHRRMTTVKTVATYVPYLEATCAASYDVSVFLFNILSVASILATSYTYTQTQVFVGEG